MGYSFSNRKREVTLEIEGKSYKVDVSPTNGRFIKSIAAMVDEVVNLAAGMSGVREGGWKEISGIVDSLVEKEKAVMNIILPGQWEELFQQSGEDVIGMVDLIVYIGNQIKEGATKAVREEIEPAPAGGNAI